MPRMAVCGRRINASTDDFVSAPMLSLIARALWAATVAILAGVYDQSHDLPCLKPIIAFVSAGIIFSAIGIAIDAALLGCSCRGSLADDRPRRAVPALVITRSLYIIVDVAVAAYGLAAAVWAPKTCYAYAGTLPSTLAPLFQAAAGVALAASILLGLTVAIAWSLGLRGSKARPVASTEEALVRLSDTWARRCSRLRFLCKGVSSASLAGGAPWEAVGAALASVFSPAELLDLTASDVMAGLLLVRAEQLDQGEQQLRAYASEKSHLEHAAGQEALTGGQLNPVSQLNGRATMQAPPAFLGPDVAGQQRADAASADMPSSGAVVQPGLVPGVVAVAGQPALAHPRPQLSRAGSGLTLPVPLPLARVLSGRQVGQQSPTIVRQLQSAYDSLAAAHDERLQARRAAAAAAGSIAIDWADPQQVAVLREATHYAHWARAAYGLPLFILENPLSWSCKLACWPGGAAHQTCSDCLESRACCPGLMEGPDAHDTNSLLVRDHYKTDEAPGAGVIRLPSNPLHTSSAVLRQVLHTEAWRAKRRHSTGMVNASGSRPPVPSSGSGALAFTPSQGAPEVIINPTVAGAVFTDATAAHTAAAGPAASYGLHASVPASASAMPMPGLPEGQGGHMIAGGTVHVPRSGPGHQPTTTGMPEGALPPFRRADLLHADHSNAFFRVPWYVAVDRQPVAMPGQVLDRSSGGASPGALVVVIRGTLSADDLLTDGLAIPLRVDRDPEASLLLDGLGYSGDGTARPATEASHGPDMSQGRPGLGDDDEDADLWAMGNGTEQSGRGTLPARRPLRPSGCFVHAGMWQAARQLRDELLAKGLLKAASRAGAEVPAQSAPSEPVISPAERLSTVGPGSGTQMPQLYRPLPAVGVAQQLLQRLLQEEHGQGQAGAVGVHRGDPLPAQHEPAVAAGTASTSGYAEPSEVAIEMTPAGLQQQGASGADRDATVAPVVPRPRGLSAEALAGPVSIPALLHAEAAGIGSSPVPVTTTAPAVAGQLAESAGEPLAQGRGAGTLQLIIVGHSLGAGVAALLALQLRPWFPTLRCYALASPGALVSPNLATAMAMPRGSNGPMQYPMVTTVFLGKDLVPRLSLPNAEATMSAAVGALARATKVNKATVFFRAWLDSMSMVVPVLPTALQLDAMLARLRAVCGRGRARASSLADQAVQADGQAVTDAHARPRSFRLTVPPDAPVRTPLADAVGRLRAASTGPSLSVLSSHVTAGSVGFAVGGPGQAAMGQAEAANTADVRIAAGPDQAVAEAVPAGQYAATQEALVKLAARRALLTRPMRVPGRALHLVRVGRVASDPFSILGEWIGALIAAVVLSILRLFSRCGRGPAQPVRRTAADVSLLQAHLTGARIGGNIAGTLCCCFRRTRGIYEPRWAARGALARGGILVSASSVADHMPDKLARTLTELTRP